MSQNIVAYSLVGMFFYVLPSWMKYGNKNHNIFKIDYAKIMQNIFFYIKQKPLQPSIASFSSSSLSQMPLYQAPIIFSFKSWIAQGGRHPHAPPPGPLATPLLFTYLKQGKYKKICIKIKIIKLERRSIMIYLC